MYCAASLATLHLTALDAMGAFIVLDGLTRVCPLSCSHFTSGPALPTLQAGGP